MSERDTELTLIGNISNFLSDNLIIIQDVGIRNVNKNSQYSPCVGLFVSMAPLIQIAKKLVI